MSPLGSRYKLPNPSSGRLWQRNDGIADVLTVNQAIRTQRFTQLGQVFVIKMGITVDEDVTIVTPTVFDERTITLTFSPGIVPVAGQYLCIKELVQFYQSKIVSVTPVAGDTYILSMRQKFDYAFGLFVEYGIVPCIKLQNTNIAVDGSITNQIAEMSPKGLLPGVGYDAHGATVTILSTSPMDDKKFGSLIELEYGVMSRFYAYGILIKNTSHYVNNQSFPLQGFEYKYNDKAPSGFYGFTASVDFDRAYGTSTAFRNISETAYDYYHLIIQDDLSDLTEVKVALRGNLTIAESIIYGV